MKKLLKRVLWGSVAGIVLATAGAFAYVMWPLPDGLVTRSAGTGVRLEDRHGLVLRTTRAQDGSLQRWLPLGDMDPDIIAAFLAVEDHRFYRHSGVDLRAIGRALRDNLRGGRVLSGGSTITMQVARIYYGTPRSLTGKLRQVLQAWRLEWHLDKTTILEQYLNRVPLGQGAVGVPAAAALYFNRGATDISLGQSALLAGLARAPSSNNPLVSQSRAAERRRVGLMRLAAVGYAVAGDIQRAGQEPLLVPARTGSFQAPHFTSRLLTHETAVPADGVWHTSLDLALQTELESEVRHTVDLLKNSGARQAAAVVLDNRTGEILAWVGSPDFWADPAGQVDMVTSPRQPGSALKPFLYGLAFDRGYTPASVLPDIAHTYATTLGPYRPRNYDRRFHGPVRAREALASSYNVPAVELTDRLSAASLLDVLHRAGFQSLARNPGYYGLGLALGNGDVSLLELANGYRTLANGGEWRATTWRRIGDPRQATTAEPRRVMTARAAALVTDILSDPVARIPGFGLETPFDFAFPVAAKTGTSRHFTDNWAVGTTRNFTVAVWVGNFNGQPMDRVSGITGAGPLLHRAVLLTAQRYPPGVLTRPEETGAVQVTICALSGLRAGPRCPHQVEWFAPGSAPERECDWHRPSGLVMPAEYQEWADQTHVVQAEFSEALASADDSSSGGFRISSPRDGDVYQVPPGVEARYATLALRAAGAGAEGRLRWTINGKPYGDRRWALEPGRYTFVARASSGIGDSASIQVLPGR
ncbi:MAG: penicillin-binding protein 1C [Gemmatimonadota bacterium]